MPKLTDEDIWGGDPPAEDDLQKDAPSVEDVERIHKAVWKPRLFGYDICGRCKHEIPREGGLKTRCPKCKAVLRNPQ